MKNKLIIFILIGFILGACIAQPLYVKAQESLLSYLFIGTIDIESQPIHGFNININRINEGQNICYVANNNQNIAISCITK